MSWLLTLKWTKKCEVVEKYLWVSALDLEENSKQIHLRNRKGRREPSPLCPTCLVTIRAAQPPEVDSSREMCREAVNHHRFHSLSVGAAFRGILGVFPKGGGWRSWGAFSTQQACLISAGKPCVNMCLQGRQTGRMDANHDKAPLC